MRQGVDYQKNFTLREYRTWKAAEEAAQKWVRKMKKDLGPVAGTYGKMNKRNKSGVVGIYPRIDRLQSPVGITDYCRWHARWPGCPLKGGVGFSAERFGDDEAFALAYLAREHQSVDREWIIKKLSSFKKSKKYQKLMAQKKQAFVDQK